MERVYLGVGSNLGDRSAFLEQAKLLVAQLPHSRLLRTSTVHETEPVGGPSQGKFLNAVWELETSLPPRELKSRLREIEERLGRRPSVPNAPREIDLDILFYGNQVINEESLKIPHPRLHERVFVLEPMAELAPNWRHPILKKTIEELLQSLERTPQ